MVGEKQALPGALLLLARLPSANAADAVRIATHLRARDNAGTAALAVSVLASRLGLGAEHPAVKDAVSAMRKVCEKLPAKPTPKSALPVALAAATLLLVGSCDASVVGAATLALGCPAPVPPSWGWALAGQPRTSVDLLVAVLRFVGEQPGSVDLGPLLSALAEAPVARADGHEVIAKLLTSIGFPKGVPAGAGLRPRSLAPMERRVLEVLRAPRFDRAHLAVRALGFWSHEALVDFVLERGPRFRPVEVSGAAVPAIWAWRAAILGELPEGTALDAIVRCGDAALIADLVLNRAERPITKLMLTTEGHRARDQSMGLGLISWLEQHDKEWIARLLVARSGPYEEAFVALGLLRAAEKGLLQIGAEEERVLDGAFLSAKVVEPMRSLVERLPQGARLLANAGGIFRLG